LGKNHPQAVIDCRPPPAGRADLEGGLWSLRLLVTDPARTEAARAAAMAAGQGWRPENVAACQVPGPVLLSSRSKAAFLAGLRLVSWDFAEPRGIPVSRWAVPTRIAIVVALLAAVIGALVRYL